MMEKNKKDRGQVFDELQNMPTCNADEIEYLDGKTQPEIDYLGGGEDWWRSPNAYTDNGYLEDVSEETAREMGYLSAVGLEKNKLWMQDDEEEATFYSLEDEIVARMDEENERKKNKKE